MAILEIPVRSDLYRYSLTVAINDTDYRLRFSHNTRDDQWYLSVEQPDGTPLVSGTAVVTDTPLLARWAWDSRLPQDGFLMAIDTTGEAADPVKDDLGDRLQLLWVPLEDLD